MGKGKQSASPHRELNEHTYYFLPSQDTSRRSLDALFTQCASILNRKEHQKNQHEEYSIDTLFTLFIKITIIPFTIVYFPQLLSNDKKRPWKFCRREWRRSSDY